MPMFGSIVMGLVTCFLAFVCSMATAAPADVAGCLLHAASRGDGTRCDASLLYLSRSSVLAPDALPQTFQTWFELIFGCAFATYMIVLLYELRRFTKEFFLSREVAHAQSKVEEEAFKWQSFEPTNAVQDTPALEAPKPPSWSLMAIMGLCSYRFYTGFLSATWLPYLLAMEGAAMWGAYQSLFMGYVKLIYAATILTEPFFGWLYDKLARQYHGLGRRLYLRMGITCACLGIFMCLWAAPRGWTYTFMVGITVWRLGEALNDVTIESIAPELLPPHQFQVASAIKAFFFLIGGLLGYIALLLTANVHYTWLYYAYLSLMIPMALPTFMILDDDVSRHIRRVTMPGDADDEKSWLGEVQDAYCVPARLKGGFPRLQWACCIYMCGTAPIFFLILIIRDVVGITDAAELQVALSKVSIAFLLAAAVSAVSTGGGGASEREARAQDGENRQEHQQDKVRRLTVCVVFLTFNAVLTFLLPFVYLWQSVETRLKVFVCISLLLGIVWGQGYARFQDLTWRLLPERDVDVGNAMGFSVMLRNTGTGLGNFVSGAILSFFPLSPFLMTQGQSMWSASTHTNTLSHNAQNHLGITDSVQYNAFGYIVVCAMCTITTLIGAYMVWSITSLIQGDGPRKPG
jgi:hypothetical protein